jgi:hypothetical protein
MSMGAWHGNSSYILGSPVRNSATTVYPASSGLMKNNSGLMKEIPEDRFWVVFKIKKTDTGP